MACKGHESDRTKGDTMYLKLFAIPCYDGSGDYMDNFWRFVRNTGQEKSPDWVELTGLRSESESDMATMKMILRMKKDILLDCQRISFQKMHDCAVNRAMRRAERLRQWEEGLKRTSL